MNVPVQLVLSVQDLGIQDRVRLHFGWLPESEVPQVLAAADLVVLPYRSGSQSAVAPLALAAGLPVLGTDVGGLSEVIRHGTNGMLVAPGSVEELKRALDGLDREDLRALRAGALRCRDSLTWDAYAEAVENLIIEVQGTDSKSPA